MIEVARAILELRGRDHEMYFSDLVNEIPKITLKNQTARSVKLFIVLHRIECRWKLSHLGLKWGLRSWYAIVKLTEIIALETDEANSRNGRKKNASNTFMDGDEDTIDYNDDDQKTKKFTKQIKYFHMMKKIQMMKRVKSKLTMLKSMKSYQMIEEVELSEEDDEREDSEDEKKNNS